MNNFFVFSAKSNLLRKLIFTSAAVAFFVVAALQIKNVVFAATVSLGNTATARSTTDTFSNFSVVDTNNPASTDGAIETFTYYAANSNPFRILLLDSSNVVKYISPEITPAVAPGENTFTPVSTVPVNTGWNLGLYFTSTGTIPFDSTGENALATANGSGLPVLGNTLSVVSAGTRTYSISAAGTATSPITGPSTSPSPTASASPTASPSLSPSPSVTPTASPSISPSPSPTPTSGFGKANGAVRYTAGNLLRRATFEVKSRVDGRQKGFFRYSDENGDSYRVNVICVKVVGNTAWFEGPVIRASNPSWLNNWLFAKVQDFAKPGIGADQISGSFVPQDLSCSLVNSMGNPADGPFTVQRGDLRVKP